MSIFPENYVSTADEETTTAKYINPRKIPDGKSITVRLCGTAGSGHSIFAYQYFTADNKPRRFPTFPKNYLEDIGLTYEGKKKGTGEKAFPKGFLFWAAYSKEAGDFVILEVEQKKIREVIEKTLNMDDYTIEPGEMANFFLTIFREGAGTDTVYSTVPTLKVPSKTDQEKWHRQREGIWLPALFEGGDPFCGRPSDEAFMEALDSSSGKRSVVPLSTRDELGADEEVAVGAGSADSWS